MQRLVEGYLFKKIGAVVPLCDESGKIVEEIPQSKYRNAETSSLNSYGGGSFCRFRIAYGHREAGVYLIVSAERFLYVGECQNLETRFSSNGYGGISPRNCFKGGQALRIEARLTQQGPKLLGVGATGHEQAVVAGPLRHP